LFNLRSYSAVLDNCDVLGRSTADFAPLNSVFSAILLLSTDISSTAAWKPHISAYQKFQDEVCDVFPGVTAQLYEQSYGIKIKVCDTGHASIRHFLRIHYTTEPVVHSHNPTIMEAATEQIRNLYAKGNARERQQIQEQMRDLQKDLYTDWETMFSLAMGVRLRYPLHCIY
jgi:hypothetical protein